MLAGNSSARSFTNTFASKAVSYLCGGNQTGPNTYSFPTGNCPDYLRAEILMPPCWNGRDVAPVGGKSHVSYFTGDIRGGFCPPEFPVRLPHMLYEIEYDTNRFKDEWKDGKSPFLWANGDRTGYSFHGDFTNGWDVDVLRTALDTCVVGGTVGECKAVTEVKDWSEARRCKKLSSVAEDVKGPLAKLPGCNGPDGGNGLVGCTDTATVVKTRPTDSATATAASALSSDTTTSTITMVSSLTFQTLQFSTTTL
jgi:hypothetical protein